MATINNRCYIHRPMCKKLEQSNGKLEGGGAVSESFGDFAPDVPMCHIVLCVGVKTRSVTFIKG